MEKDIDIRRGEQDQNPEQTSRSLPDEERKNNPVFRPVMEVALQNQMGAPDQWKSPRHVAVYCSVGLAIPVYTVVGKNNYDVIRHSK